MALCSHNVTFAQFAGQSNIAGNETRIAGSASHPFFYLIASSELNEIPVYGLFFLIQDVLHFPSTLDELKLITSALLEFQQFHPVYVFILFCTAYIYKQTFAIPGSVFMVTTEIHANFT